MNASLRNIKERADALEAELDEMREHLRMIKRWLTQGAQDLALEHVNAALAPKEQVK